MLATMASTTSLDLPSLSKIFKSLLDINRWGRRAWTLYNPGHHLIKSSISWASNKDKFKETRHFLLIRKSQVTCGRFCLPSPDLTGSQSCLKCSWTLTYKKDSLWVPKGIHVLSYLHFPYYQFRCWFEYQSTSLRTTPNGAFCRYYLQRATYTTHFSTNSNNSSSFSGAWRISKPIMGFGTFYWMKSDSSFSFQKYPFKIYN